MNIEELRNHCLSVKGAVESYSLQNHNILVCKVMEKVFVYIPLEPEDGSLSFEGELYPANILTGKGVIGGITVNCLTVEAQIMYHQGYELKDKDIQDVRLFCRTFGQLL